MAGPGANAHAGGYGRTRSRFGFQADESAPTDPTKFFSVVLISVSPALHDLLLVGTASVVALTIGVIVAAVWLRRRWRRLRRMVALQIPDIAREANLVAWRWIWTRPLPDSRWRRSHQARRRLNRAVTGAERAVAVAGSAGAPLGDLESLCHRMRRVATSVDAQLWMSQGTTGPSSDPAATLRQSEAIVAAAGRIQETAVAAMRGTALELSDLVDDVHREVAAVAVGTHRAYGEGGAHGGAPAGPLT